MSKYDSLGEFLANARHETITLTFEQLDVIVPGKLPPSARRHAAWWGNGDPSHHHCRSWGDAGYEAAPSLERGFVTFHPRTPGVAARS